MNSKQRKRREYLISKGFIKSEPELLKRTEEGKQFTYPARLEIYFVKFSGEKRDHNEHPLFSDYYASLPTDIQNQITVTNIYNYEKR